MVRLVEVAAVPTSATPPTPTGVLMNTLPIALMRRFDGSPSGIVTLVVTMTADVDPAVVSTPVACFTKPGEATRSRVLLPGDTYRVSVSVWNTWNPLCRLRPADVKADRYEARAASLPTACTIVICRHEPETKPIRQPKVLWK